MTATECQVEQYTRGVVDGEIVAGRLVRLACQRHLRDLEEGPARGLHFDADAAVFAIEFFSLLHLPDSEKPFKLSPFQAFIVGSLWGWKAEDGSRRFRTAYVESGKGSGKSPLGGGIGLLGMVADGEQAAEIYSAATTREQASILFRDAKRIVDASPSLSRRLNVGQANIADEKSGSFFRPVSSEHRGLDGKRVHIALVDELHEHPTAMVVDKMRAGTKGRRQALIFEITNSGWDRNSVCYKHREYSEKVLEQSIEDDSWFAYVCTLDACDKHRAEGKTMPHEGCPDCDDWQNEACWAKANPNIGVSLTLKYLREQVREAVGMPSKQSIVKRLNFCIWTESETRAIDMERWRACGLGVDGKPVAAKWWREAAIERLKGKPCIGGLDLGSTSDLTALALLFEEEEDSRKLFTILPYYWVPKDSAAKRQRKDRVPYLVWIEQGFVKPTEGDVTDYDQVRRDINDLAGYFAIRFIEVDRLFQGAQLCTQLLGDGFEVEAFGQGFFSMAAPVKRMLELVAAGEINHGNNPPLTWNAGNAVTEQDAAGNLKFSKKKSSEKIDGLVASVMALGKQMSDPSGGGSIYDSPGNLQL